MTVEADYTLQKWSGVKYNNRTDLYQDRSKVAIGAEFYLKSSDETILPVYAIEQGSIMQTLIFRFQFHKI